MDGHWTLERLLESRVRFLHALHEYERRTYPRQMWKKLSSKARLHHIELQVCGNQYQRDAGISCFALTIDHCLYCYGANLYGMRQALRDIETSVGLGIR